MFKQKKLGEKRRQRGKKMEKLSSDIQRIYKYQIDLKSVQDKLRELEGISRQSDVGIKETKEETCGGCEEKFQDILAQKLRLDHIEIEPAIEKNMITEAVILIDRPEITVMKILW